jgi:hypothetical protein
VPGESHTSSIKIPRLRRSRNFPHIFFSFFTILVSLESADISPLGSLACLLGIEWLPNFTTTAERLFWHSCYQSHANLVSNGYPRGLITCSVAIQGLITTYLVPAGSFISPAAFHSGSRTHKLRFIRRPEIKCYLFESPLLPRSADLVKSDPPCPVVHTETRLGGCNRGGWLKACCHGLTRCSWMIHIAWVLSQTDGYY